MNIQQLLYEQGCLEDIEKSFSVFNTLLCFTYTEQYYILHMFWACTFVHMEKL